MWLALTDTDPSKARIVYGGEWAQRDGAIEIVPWRAL